MMSINNGAGVLIEKKLDTCINSGSVTARPAEKHEYKTYWNPCMFNGRTELVSLDDGSIISTHPYNSTTERAVLFEGSGDSTGCALFVKEMLWTSSGDKEECTTSDKRCPIDGVVPPIMEDLHFFGMSAYYYALDCVRKLGPSVIANWYDNCFMVSVNVIFCVSLQANTVN